MNKENSGFTLIEILVAFFIFGIIGVVSGQLLNQTLSSQKTLKEKGEHLQSLHRGIQILQRDIMQYVDRPIRDEYGNNRAPLLIGLDGSIEFTRTGWRNPLGYKRAETQRVAYIWQDNQLIRGYWSELDRAVNSEPNYQTLLSDIERVEFFAIDAKGNEHITWPSMGGDPNDPLNRMVAVLVRIELEPNYFLERVWEIPDAI